MRWVVEGCWLRLRDGGFSIGDCRFSIEEEIRASLPRLLQEIWERDPPSLKLPFFEEGLGLVVF